MKKAVKLYKNFRKNFIIISIAVSAVSVFLFSIILSNSVKAINEQIEITENKNIERINTLTVAELARIQTAAASYTTMQIGLLPEVITSEDILRYNNYENQLYVGTSLIEYIQGIFVKNGDAQIIAGNVYQGDNTETISDYKNITINRVLDNRWIIQIVLNKNTYMYQNDVSVTIVANTLGRSVLGEDYDKNHVELITDSKGNIVIANTQSLIGKNINQQYDIDLALEKGFCNHSQGGRKIFSKELNNTDFYIVSISEKPYYNAFYKSLYTRLVIYLIIAATISILIAALISTITYRPMRLLLKSVNDYFPIPVFESIDETMYIRNLIEQMYSNYNSASEKANNLMIALKQQQVIALQLQVSPHFLYNTLDAINWIALDKLGSDNPISYCIQRTDKILRSSIDIVSFFATLEEEMEESQNCLEILNVRFGLDIKFKTPIEKDIKEIKILKNCLQPIVENAVYHGFANEDIENCEIKITVEMKGKDLTVCVSDNGIGIKKEALDELRERINDFEDEGWNHIGLRNVNYRLKLLYGEKYGIIITSEYGKGTDCILKMPILDL